VTLPNNFVTVFHSFNTDLDMDTPWPKPDNYVPKDADQAILIWGGSSSVGQFAIQILRYYGYKNVLATASHKHHDKLRSLGAREVFDYNDAKVIESILQYGSDAGIPLTLDCIGSQKGSIKPISNIAKAGSKVAILLPVVVRDSTETETPEYEMEVKVAADWREGVDVRGVRTHQYLDVSNNLPLCDDSLMKYRMSFSSIICNLISCPQCSKTASCQHRNRESSRVRPCSKEHRRPWIR